MELENFDIDDLVSTAYRLKEAKEDAERKLAVTNCFLCVLSVVYVISIIILAHQFVF